MISRRKHSFGLRLVGHSSINKTCLPAKFQVGNAAFDFFSKYLVVGRKSTKMIITREQRREGMNPLQVFHTSLGSTYRQKMGPRRLEHLNMFPRKRVVATSVTCWHRSGPIFPIIPMFLKLVL